MSPAAPRPATLRPAAAAPREHDLVVAEARPEDADRGIVRLDPALLAELELETGDLVRVTGPQGTTYGRALPARVEQRGQGRIQIDSAQRDTVGARIGEHVRVAVAEAVPARSVRLAATAGEAARLEAGALRGRLLDLPLAAGGRLRTRLVGGRILPLRVVATVPDGPVVVTETTVVEIDRETEAGPAKLGYEDIGGLGRELSRIREMIELPLQRPELFATLGIDPPKGVLLSGPPGTGKTLIARAVADAAGAFFTVINGPEIVDRFYGASEAQLRATFEEARRKAPAVLFIDELDAIAPKRAEMTGDRQVERRIVAQLLTLMDGLERRGRIVVIAATNLPDSLDPALRRPGRFDREIRLGVPDPTGRLEILQIHSRGMRLAEDVRLERLAAATHGYVGADLAALVREAGMSALRRLDLAAPAGTAKEGPPDGGAAPFDLAVTMADFEAALHEVAPSALRETRIELPPVRWSDVGGLQEVKARLTEAVQWPQRHPQLFADLGLRPPRGILLHGAPGTGKTLLARALAHESGHNLIAVKGPELLSRYVGESERALRELFAKGRLTAPCILFMDEIDALVPVRAARNDVGERLVAQLLTELDGIEALEGVLLLAATNRVELIDPALLRPGRFDLVVELPPPDRVARREILAIHARNLPLPADLDLDALAAEAAGLSGADLEAACRAVALETARRAIARGWSGGDLPAVDHAMFAHALAEIGARSRERTVR